MTDELREGDFVDSPLLSSSEQQQERKKLTFWHMLVIESKQPPIAFRCIDITRAMAWSLLVIFLLKFVAYCIVKMIPENRPHFHHGDWYQTDDGMSFSSSTYGLDAEDKYRIFEQSDHLGWALLLLFSIISLSYQYCCFRKTGPIGYLLGHKAWQCRWLFGKNSPPYVALLSQVACIHTIQGEPEEAEKVLWDITHNLPIVSTHPDGASCFESHARVLTTLHHREEALEALQGALRLRRKNILKNRLKFVNTSKQLALAHLAIEETNQANNVLEESVEVLKAARMEKSVEHAKVLALMARVCKAQGDLVKALELLQQAKDTYLYNGSHFAKTSVVAKLDTEMGNVLVEQGDAVEQAREAFQAALEIYRHMGFADDHACVSTLLDKLKEITETV